MNDQDRAFAKAIVQGLVLLVVVVLQDPEIRRNAIWGLQWTGDRLRSMLNPDDDEPPAPEVSKVIEAARAITMNPNGPTTGKAGN